MRPGRLSGEVPRNRFSSIRSSCSVSTRVSSWAWSSGASAWLIAAPYAQLVVVGKRELPRAAIRQPQRHRASGGTRDPERCFGGGEALRRDRLAVDRGDGVALLPAAARRRTAARHMVD